LTAVHLKIAFSTAFVPFEKFPADFSNPAKGVTETDEVPIGILFKIGKGLTVGLMVNGWFSIFISLLSVVSVRW